MNSLKRIVEQMHAFAERMSNGYAIIEYELLSEWIRPIEALMEQEVFPETSAPGWFDSLESFATNTAAPQDCEGPVPGIEHCDKCDFTLTVNRLNMGNGTVTAGSADGESCPNGCGPMRPVTWKEWATEGWKRAETAADEREEMRKELDQLKLDSASSALLISALESSCDEVIKQRDKAEDALGEVYQLATGRAAEWSNCFGYADAVNDISAELERANETIARLKRDSELCSKEDAEKARASDSYKLSMLLCDDHRSACEDGLFKTQYPDEEPCLMCLAESWKSELEQYKRDGWKLVPVEPTKEMVAAACREHGYPGGNRRVYALGYRAMLNAVPENKG